MFKKLLSLLSSNILLVVLSIVFSLISVVSNLFIPYIFGISIDYIIGENNVDFNAITNNLIIILALIGISSLTQYIMSLVNNHISYKTIEKLRNNCIDKLEKLPLAYLDQHPKGETISRVISDCEQLENGILMTLSQFFTGIATIIGVLIFMICINLWVSLFVILLTPISLFVARTISKNSYASFKKQSELRGKQTSIIDEMIGNQKVVSAYLYEEKSLEKFKKSNQELSEVSLKATFISSLTNPSTRFVNSIIYATVALIGSLICINNGEAITVGMLVCLLGYANQYTKPFNEISGVIAELQNAFACASRIFDFIEEKDEIENVVTEIKEANEIKIENISFSYNPNQDLINNFSLNVKKGERIAIVGPTGCGKTTFINLLMRFYDVNSGDITISDESIYSVSRKDLRSHFGMVLQDTWIRNATIKENLIMGNNNASMEEIIEVCKKVKIYHFIKQLPNGFDTIIDNENSLLSKGQRQLLCIGRVMLTKPEFLILDEATSNIDTRTELLVQEAFKELMIGKTSFVVAHRLSTIKECNRIIVMKDGKIQEIGTHQELLNKKGLYFEMYNAQYSN